MKVLLVEDDQALAAALGDALRDAGLLLERPRAVARPTSWCVPSATMRRSSIWACPTATVPAGWRSGATTVSTAEVLFRLRALVRRSHGHAHPVLTSGELAFDTHTGSVTLAGRPIALTAQESRLLAYLMHAAPRIVSRIELSEHVYDRDHEPDSNVIDVQISRLRRKLGSNRIETLRGQGYRVVAVESAP